MPRRKQSFLEDLIDVTAMLPWWVGVALAVVSYLGLHQVAVMEVTAPIGTKGMADFAGKQLYKTLAMIFQYLFPAAFLGGAIVSEFTRRKRNALHAHVATSGARSAVEELSWREFEQLVGEYFRRQGFSIAETGGAGADGGVDLVLSRGSDRYFVQCKQWKARQVGVVTVRELYGVMAAKGAAGGYVVTSGVFTEEAKRFAEGREINLIEGDQLAQLIAEQSASSARSIAAQANDLLPRGKREASASASEVPACPQCGLPMVLRTARKGAQAGISFWGCSAFPKCRGTRPA